MSLCRPAKAPLAVDAERQRADATDRETARRVDLAARRRERQTELQAALHALEERTARRREDLDARNKAACRRVAAAQSRR